MRFSLNGGDKDGTYPSNVNKNSDLLGEAKTLTQVSTNTTKKPTTNTAGSSDVNDARKMYQLLWEEVFFVNNIILSEDENRALQEWHERTGVFLNPVTESDYGSYDKQTLFELTKNGDLRAIEALRSQAIDLSNGNDISELTLELDRTAMLSGSIPAIRNIASTIKDQALQAFENGDLKAYKSHFIDMLAHYKLAEIRGDLNVSQVFYDKALEKYKLDNIDSLEATANIQGIALYNHLNNMRTENGWPPFDDNVPDVTKRMHMASFCEGNLSCMRDLTCDEVKHLMPVANAK